MSFCGSETLKAKLAELDAEMVRVEQVKDSLAADVLREIRLRLLKKMYEARFLPDPEAQK